MHSTMLLMWLIDTLNGPHDGGSNNAKPMQHDEYISGVSTPSTLCNRPLFDLQSVQHQKQPTHQYNPYVIGSYYQQQQLHKRHSTHSVQSGCHPQSVPSGISSMGSGDSRQAEENGVDARRMWMQRVRRTSLTTAAANTRSTVVGWISKRSTRTRERYKPYAYSQAASGYSQDNCPGTNDYQHPFTARRLQRQGLILGILDILPHDDGNPYALRIIFSQISNHTYDYAELDTPEAAQDWRREVIGAIFLSMRNIRW
ncbi:hypothetical protein BDZ89DRAFT_1034985 [Hymenopellis radicata]|nr:hypothetical protein BDZ89DRAFT_1034985 [Hymenopellis radicata]